MSVREFTDGAGEAWTAWNVTPEGMHPQTRAEDYLVDCFQLGWLVFESSRGQEKRRLCPYPVHWDKCTVAELQGLLARADAVPSSRPRPERAVVAAPADDRRPQHAAAAVNPLAVRTFRYPDGRFWTACVMSYPDDGGQPRLRFASGARFIDLAEWPREWALRTDDQLVDLLRVASPRQHASASHAGRPSRRWGDRP